MEPRLHRDLKHAYGRTFGAHADTYDRIRPGYPESTVAWMTEGLEPGAPTLDVGAGTGKLSVALQAAGLEVLALDPDAASLARNPVPVLEAGAEAIPRPDASAELVTVAQAWHWLDTDRAVPEIERVLAPGGRLAIVLNQLDVRVDWVLRLSRIMHAGDVYRPAWRPVLGGWASPVETRIEEFTVPMTLSELVDLAGTRTYWLRSSPEVRARVKGNLHSYWIDELGLAEDTVVELPYLCLAYRAAKTGTSPR